MLRRDRIRIATVSETHTEAAESRDTKATEERTSVNGP